MRRLIRGLGLTPDTKYLHEPRRNCGGAMHGHVPECWEVAQWGSWEISGANMDTPAHIAAVTSLTRCNRRNVAWSICAREPPGARMILAPARAIPLHIWDSFRDCLRQSYNQSERCGRRSSPIAATAAGMPRGVDCCPDRPQPTPIRRIRSGCCARDGFSASSGYRSRPKNLSP